MTGSTVALTVIALLMLGTLAWGVHRVLWADARDQEATEAGAGYLHTVGYVQGVWSALVGAAPRARCGASLAGEPGEPELGSDAPACPACAE